MRTLANWEIESLREQHGRAISGNSGFAPVSEFTEVRDDTEPGGRRRLTVEELWWVRGGEGLPINEPLPTPKANFTTDPNRKAEDLKRDMDATVPWFEAHLRQRHGADVPKPTRNYDSRWPEKPTVPKRIQTTQPSGVAYRLTVEILHIPVDPDHPANVYDACQRALRAQDDLIAQYQRLEIERAMSQPGPTYFPKGNLNNGG